MSRSTIIRERLFECIHKGELENSDMVQIIEHLSIILNLQTQTSFAKSNNISYNGVKFAKNRRVIIDRQNFIVNNP